MRKYQFIIRVGNRIVTTIIHECGNLEVATMFAESFLRPEMDGFADNVIFSEINPDKIHIWKYRIEKWVEKQD